MTKSEINLKKRQEDFYNKLKENGVLKRLKILTPFVNNKSYIKCECLIHPGEFFEVNARTLKDGGGYCKKCQSNFSKNNKQKTHAQFIKELDEINALQKYEVLSTYINSKTKIKCKCLKCGNIFENTPNHLLKGQGCPECAKEINPMLKRMTQKDFDKILIDKNIEYERIDDFINMTTPIKFKCKKCGHIFVMKPCHILERRQCSVCKDKSSFNNRLLRIICMKSNLENFKCEKIFDWAKDKRYDVYFTIFKDNKIKEYIVEAQGGQHYEDTNFNGVKISSKKVKKNDKIKYNLAKQHNIEIIYLNCHKKTHQQIVLEYKEKLKDIIDFSKIDLIECVELAEKNIIKLVNDDYMELIKLNKKSQCIKILMEKYKIANSTVRKYLRIGSSYNWSNYSFN